MNLVTGATGIVGSNVVFQLLRQNLPVIACKQSNSDISKVEELFSYYSSDFKELFSKIKWVDIDVCDFISIEEALEGVDNVYHCAGLVSFNKKDKKQLFKINERGTANVVNACLNKKIKALCHVSSVATINNLDIKNHLTENIFWKTSGKESDYAISKYKGECEVWRGIEEGLNAVIVNPGVILSPGFSGQSSSKLFSFRQKNSKFYTLGNAGYVSAQDLACVMINLVEKCLFANRYIVIENNYTYKTIFDLIQRYLKKEHTTIYAGRFLLQIAVLTEYLRSKVLNREPAITKTIVQAAFNQQLYSNNKILNDLKYNFTPINQVISQICDTYFTGRNKKT